MNLIFASIMHIQFMKINIQYRIFKKQLYSVKGRLGINNGVSDLESYFRESSDFKALILARPGKFMVSLKFRNQDLLEKFGEIHKWKSVPLQGKTVVMKSGETVLRKGEKELVVEIPEGSQNGGIIH